MSRILVVEDEPHIADGMRFNLEAEGHEVTVTGDGEQALALLVEDQKPMDVVILDVMLPGKDGFESAAELRAAGQYVPILMLTARGRADDVLRGFEAGADDYLAKPFALEELRARLRALLRRSGAGAGLIRFADLELDVAAHQASRCGMRLPLTKTEFALLELFLRNPGRVLSRTQIFESVWGYDFGPESNGLWVYIGYLRRKMGEPRLIQTVRGIGYVLREDP
jgi:two-component system response regulator MprA